MINHNYYVYFLTNWTGKVLYTGVTHDLEARIETHRQKILAGFSKTYNLTKLVYYEHYTDIRDAIAREKQIKNWRRDKKDFLVNKINPDWDNLFET